MLRISRGGKTKLRNSVVALMAVAVLGVGSTAMARGGGGGGGHGGGGMGAMHSGGMGAMHSGWGGRSMAMVPMHSGSRGHPFAGRPFARNAFFHDRFHGFRRFHHRNVFFVGAGFSGYDSCWVWTYWGWRNVCGYPYWAY